MKTVAQRNKTGYNVFVRLRKRFRKNVSELKGGKMVNDKH